MQNSIEAVFVGWQYDKITKRILSEYKYRYSYRVSGILGNLLLDRLKSTGFLSLINSNDILLPIPSHIKHLRKRGFNQSTLVAKHLSQKLGLEIKEDYLIRYRDSRYQSQLDLKDRKGLKNVFKCEKDMINSEIILVDDVITTGSTINRAARALKAKSIKALALFRGRPHYSQTNPQ
jgi:ComF family protein